MPYSGDLQARRKNFYALGDVFLKIFITTGGLKPDARVLDIGCGPGRMAGPLTSYLDARGSYVGMDVVKGCIKGCRKRICTDAPNFSFEHMDVFNARYNRGGSVAASAHSFPFSNESFDFIFLTSVFTHMLKDDCYHYIEEISRLLAPVGTCLATFFLYDSQRLQQSRTHDKCLRFQFPEGDGVLIEKKAEPEYAVAYPRESVLSHIRYCGLQVEEVLPGGWDGTVTENEYQDLVVCRK